MSRWIQLAAIFACSCSSATDEWITVFPEKQYNIDQGDYRSGIRPIDGIFSEICLYGYDRVMCEKVGLPSQISPYFSGGHVLINDSRGSSQSSRAKILSLSGTLDIHSEAANEPEVIAALQECDLTNDDINSYIVRSSYQEQVVRFYIAPRRYCPTFSQDGIEVSMSLSLDGTVRPN
jgi:hypothetical protein